jgi:cupin fold WbuC family metalloprotein
MMKLISEELLDGVTHDAQENSRLRMNYNFHESLDAPIHRLLNAMEPGTYLPPHRHVDKEETYIVLRGSLIAFFYDDMGNVTEKVNLNPSAGMYGVEIPSGTWHSIVVLESGTVIFEIKSRGRGRGFARRCPGPRSTATRRCCAMGTCTFRCGRRGYIYETNVGGLVCTFKHSTSCQHACPNNTRLVF